MAILKSKNLTLRPLKLRDAKDIYKNANHKLVARFKPDLPWPFKRRHALQFVLLKRKKKDEMHFAIVDNITKEVIGSTNLHKIDLKNKNATVGIWIGNNHWGKGFYLESRKLLFNHAFKKLKLKRINFFTFKENKRAQKAIKKTGAKKEGTKRSAIYSKNRYHDLYLYGLLKREWHAKKFK